MHNGKMVACFTLHHSAKPSMDFRKGLYPFGGKGFSKLITAEHFGFSKGIVGAHVIPAPPS